MYSTKTRGQTKKKGNHEIGETGVPTKEKVEENSQECDKRNSPTEIFQEKHNAIYRLSGRCDHLERLIEMHYQHV